MSDQDISCNYYYYFADQGAAVLSEYDFNNKESLANLEAKEENWRAKAFKLRRRLLTIGPIKQRAEFVHLKQSPKGLNIAFFSGLNEAMEAYTINFPNPTGAPLPSSLCLGAVGYLRERAQFIGRTSPAGVFRPYGLDIPFFYMQPFDSIPLGAWPSGGEVNPISRMVFFLSDRDGKKKTFSSHNCLKEKCPHYVNQCGGFCGILPKYALNYGNDISTEFAKILADNFSKLNSDKTPALGAPKKNALPPNYYKSLEIYSGGKSDDRAVRALLRAEGLTLTGKPAEGIGGFYTFSGKLGDNLSVSIESPYNLPKTADSLDFLIVTSVINLVREKLTLGPECYTITPEEVLKKCLNHDSIRADKLTEERVINLIEKWQKTSLRITKTDNNTNITTSRAGALLPISLLQIRDGLIYWYIKPSDLIPIEGVSNKSLLGCNDLEPNTLVVKSLTPGKESSLERANVRRAILYYIDAANTKPFKELKGKNVININALYKEITGRNLEGEDQYIKDNFLRILKSLFKKLKEQGEVITWALVPSDIREKKRPKLEKLLFYTQKMMDLEVKKSKAPAGRIKAIHDYNAEAYNDNKYYKDYLAELKEYLDSYSVKFTKPIEKKLDDRSRIDIANR